MTVGKRVRTAVHKYINTKKVAQDDLPSEFAKGEARVKKKKKKESFENELEILEFPSTRRPKEKSILSPVNITKPRTSNSKTSRVTDTSIVSG